MWTCWQDWGFCVWSTLTKWITWYKTHGKRFSLNSSYWKVCSLELRSPSTFVTSLCTFPDAMSTQETHTNVKLILFAQNIIAWSLLVIKFTSATTHTCFSFFRNETRDWTFNLKPLMVVSSIGWCFVASGKGTLYYIYAEEKVRQGWLGHDTHSRRDVCLLQTLPWC